MPRTAARRRWELVIAVALVLQLSVAATATIRLRDGATCTVQSGSAQSSAAGDLTRELRAACLAAISRVSSVWGKHWARHVVVVLPPTSDEPELSSLPDADALAAVVDARHRVILNPVAFAQLSTTGRDVVLAHELTHVATGDTRRRVPTWLAEGFADYVGFLHRGIPVQRAAAELAAQVRSGRLPATLPADAAFDGPDLSSTYQQSWLAVALLARVLGKRGLVRCYRAVLAGASLESALAPAHLTIRELTRRWRLDLLRQLR